MRMRSKSLPVSIFVLLLVVAFAFATRSEAGSAPQDPQTPPTGAPGGAGQERPGRPDQPVEPKPYEKVITKDAKSDEGIFTIHTVKEKVYYEIPKKGTQQRVSLGKSNRQDNFGSWLWWSGGRKSRREVGTQRQSNPASKCVVRSRCRSEASCFSGRASREQRHHYYGV